MEILAVSLNPEIIKDLQILLGDKDCKILTASDIRGADVWLTGFCNAPGLYKTKQIILANQKLKGSESDFVTEEAHLVWVSGDACVYKLAEEVQRILERRSLTLVGAR